MAVAGLAALRGATPRRDREACSSRGASIDRTALNGLRRPTPLAEYRISNDKPGVLVRVHHLVRRIQP